MITMQRTLIRVFRSCSQDTKLGDVLSNIAQYGDTQFFSRSAKPSIRILSTGFTNASGLSYVTVTTDRRLKFNVGYVDSQPYSPYNPDVPIVLGLHGSPGSHKDLDSVMVPLSKRGYRTVSINFPGVSVTTGVTSQDSDAFSHSPSEKADFVASFVKELNITRVDMAIAHSAACYTLYHLAVTKKLCKSVLYLAPAPHVSQWNIQLMYLWKSLAFTPFIRLISGPLIYILRKSTVFGRFTADEMKITTLTMTSERHDMMRNAALVRESHVPRIMVYGHRDALVKANTSKQLAETLGLYPENFTTYDKQGNSVGDPTKPGLSRGILFKEGSHYPQWSYHVTITDAAIKMIESIRGDHRYEGR